MSYGRIGMCLTLLLLGWTLSAWGQNAGPADGPPPSSDDAARLRQYRQIIEKTADSMGTRCLQAEDLLRTRRPEATDIAVELLGAGSDPSTRMVVCDAITNVGAADSALLAGHHGRLVEPLLQLLGDRAEGVSARAAKALAAFADAGVTRRLAELAGNAEAPLAQRVAAVDALALNVYDREAVRRLVALLGKENGEFRARVLKALADGSQQDLGPEVVRWQAWWEHEEAALSDAEWVLRRLRLFFGRLQEAQRQLQQVREDYERRCGALAERLTDVLRENYRLRQQSAQKEETLIRWLKDPQPEAQLAAMTIVSEEIQDGNPPSETVVDALLGELGNRSPAVRRAVLGIIGALGSPEKAAAVLSLLEKEKESAVRQTALRVLGQLRNPDAIAILIGEISNPSSPVGCVAESAGSLAVLGAKGRVAPEVIAPVIPVLVERFDAAPATDLRVRESLLRAMAGIGAPEFAETLSDVLDSEQAQLLLPAIQGLIGIGNAAGSMDRLLTLTGHAEPRVRAAAVEAVGVLGGEPAHIEVLTGRLSPSAETSDTVRNAAWAACRRILRDRKPNVRLQWADRLRETPERQVACYEELIKDLAAENPAPPELNEARRRLGALHMQRGDPAAALPIWQQLYSAMKATADPEAPQMEITVLSAALSAGLPRAIAESLEELSSADRSIKARAVEVVTEHLQGQIAANPPPVLAAMVDAMLSSSLDGYGEPFRSYLENVKRQLTVSTRPAATDAGPASAPAATESP